VEVSVQPHLLITQCAHPKEAAIKAVRSIARRYSDRALLRSASGRGDQKNRAPHVGRAFGVAQPRKFVNEEKKP